MTEFYIIQVINRSSTTGELNPRKKTERPIQVTLIQDYFECTFSNYRGLVVISLLNNYCLIRKKKNLPYQDF